MLFGDKTTRIEPRRRSSKLKILLFTAVAFEAFTAKTLLDFDLHSSQAEAFVPFHCTSATRGSCVSVSPRPRKNSPSTSSCSFILTPKMTSRKSAEIGAGPSDANPIQPRKNNSQQSQKDKGSSRGRSREATTNAAPMYITIGPQCCGKSSFLRNHGNGTIKDVSLDDQKDVYVPIPTEVFLHAYNNDEDGGGGTKNSSSDKLLDPLIQQVYQGKTLAERIRENVELILILRRWNGDSKASDFERRVKNFYRDRSWDGSVADALVKAVEDFLSDRPDLPKETDVFVLESLFKPHPETGQSAIQRAHEELRETPKHIPVAWGNTNSKAKDYERALEICHQTRRPVRFVLSHPRNDDCGSDNANNESEFMTLPWLSLEELLKRNLHRLQTQGKFVPANAIADCRERVEAMIPPRNSSKSTGAGNTKWIEEHLVTMASPSGATGGRGQRGRQDNRKPGPTFRYVLTKHRLVQKEYPRNVSGSNYRPSNNQGRNFRGRFSNDGGRGRQGRYNEGRGRGSRGRYNNGRRGYHDGAIEEGNNNNNNGRYLNPPAPRPPPPNQDATAPPRARRRYNNNSSDTRNDNPQRYY